MIFPDLRNYIKNFIFKIKNNSVFVGKGISISSQIIIGTNCRLMNYCSLSESTILGDNIIIGRYAELNHIQIDNNSFIETGVKVVGTGKGTITIGKECYIGINNILDCSDNIVIGDFVHIAGPSTALWCHSSWQMCMNSIPINDEGRDKYRPAAPIVVGNNTYIGGNCTIYPGITIGDHSIIAPNSVVSKNVEPYTLVGGVPAKFIKKIDSK